MKLHELFNYTVIPLLIFSLFLKPDAYLKYIIKSDGSIFVNIHFCQYLRYPVYQGIIWNLLNSLDSIFQFLDAHQFFTGKGLKLIKIFDSDSSIVMQYGLVGGYKYLKGTNHLHLQAEMGEDRVYMFL